MSGAASAVVFILLDAFRHDYLGRTRFLKRVARQSLVGRLEEPFGFCPRGAYFGGLTVAEQGYSNLLHFDPANSVFRWTAHLHGTGSDSWLRQALRDEIVGRARAQLPEFSAAYVDPLDIPLDRLGLFDVSEKEAPWSRGVGYRSLFHVMDDAGCPWMEVSWPFRGVAPDDRGVADVALQRLGAAPRFSFIHLPSLDAAGHCHGPGSIELQRHLEAADGMCSELVDRAMQVHDDPIFLFAGDHGMLPVVRSVDAMAALEATGLRYGHDIVFFVDSTLVRCWFLDPRARTAATAALERLGGGSWLAPADRDRWGLTGLDVRSGEEFFLADPGVVFAPSFFDARPCCLPRGMHGYAPDVEDNRALFMAWRPKGRFAGDVGVVQARRLFPTFLRWLGWDASQFTSVEPVREECSRVTKDRWTCAAGPAADEVVSRHLSRAVEGVRERVPTLSALVLTGAFGRGEGTVEQRSEGWKPVNDYDLIVVGSDEAGLSDLSCELAREFDLDFVDLVARKALERASPPSQLDFDLRHGSRVLWGEEAVLEAMAPYAPEEIPSHEGAYLLGNRLGGLLLGVSGWSKPPTKERFLRHQFAKVLIALADAWLMRVSDYHASYEIRRIRFGALARAAGFSETLVSRIDEAFQFKLRSRSLALGTSDANVVAECIDGLREFWEIAGWDALGAGFQSVLEHSLRAHVFASERWLAEARSLGLQPLLPAGCDGFPLVFAVYRAMVAVLSAWSDSESARRQLVADALGNRWRVHESIDDASLPRILAEVWLALFH